MPSVAPAESFVDMTFPVNGLDVSVGFSNQTPKTTPLGVNVRTYEPSTNRARGGSRPGLTKYLAAGLGGLIQDLACLIGVGYTPPGGAAQTSSSGRIVSLVAVVGGNVSVLSAGATSWVAATNGASTTPPLATGGVIRSTSLNQKLYFADGIHYVYYDPATNTVKTLAATAGSLPGPNDLSQNAPRLICTWRGRLVYSGLQGDPQNWFMSAVGDPTNWDTAPTTPSPTQAITGNDSPLGLIGDVVTALVPYSDDVLFVGGDHTLWQIAGDPMAGGQIDLVSDAIGMAWGIPWCKDPTGAIYFVSNRTGIYAYMPGQGPPQRISQQIENLLSAIDTGTNTIRLIWDDLFQGLHVFITPTSGAAAATHYFWEQRVGAWWQDTFANNNHNPLCCCVFDGNTASDRRPLLGSWDGYVRYLKSSATTDDSTAIASSVMIGPLLTKDMDMVLFKDLQGELGAASSSVTYGVYVGSTAEIALASAPVVTGTWSAGRNLNALVRRAGHALYVQLSSSNPWAMERIRARVAGKGKVQRRGV